MTRRYNLFYVAALMFGSASGQAAAPLRLQATTGLDWTIDCSRPPTASARPAGGPVDDFAGLRMGLSLDEAAAAAVCVERGRSPGNRADARFVASVNGLHPFDYLGQSVRTGGVLGIGSFVPRGEMPRFPSADGGEAALTPYFCGTMVSWSFHAFGLPGKEKVYGFTRNERFADDTSPDLETLRKQVLQKYGPPHRIDEGVGAVEMSWAYDSTGKPVPIPRSNVVTCPAPIYAGEGIQVDPSGTCGVAIRVRIAKQHNVYKAAGLYLGIVHGSAMGKAIAQTQDGIRDIARGGQTGATVKSF